MRARPSSGSPDFRTSVMPTPPDLSPPALRGAVSQPDAAPPLKLLHVVEAFGGGTYEVVRTLATGLAEAGHHVTVAHGRRPVTPSAIDIRRAFPPSVSLVPLGWADRRPASQLRAARALRTLARSLRPDVVHLHSSFAGFVGALALPRGIPSIFTPHGYSIAAPGLPRAERAARIAAERFVARRVSVVGAVSAPEAALARGKAHARHVVVVPNGIPELDPGREPPPRPRPVARVVAMGRVEPARRPAETVAILRAVADVAEIQWIGGPGPDAADDPALGGIPSTGWLPRSAALHALADATVLVQWSAWEGLPLSVLEAFARDVIVIGSDIPALVDILGSEQVRAEPAGAAELVREAITSPQTRSRLLAAQRDRRGAFGAATMVARWTAVYAALSAGRQLPGSQARAGIPAVN